MDTKFIERKSPIYLLENRPRVRAIVDHQRTAKTLLKLEQVPKIHADVYGRALAPNTSLGDIYYWIAYPTHPSFTTLVFLAGEIYSQFNNTTQPLVYTFTSKMTSTFTMTFEGEVGFQADIFSFKFAFSYQETVTVEADQSIQATASPGQWLTGVHGAWFDVRRGCTSYLHNRDGSDSLLSSNFELWTPTGDQGWLFNNDPPP
jgi:hypothetical protein